MYPTADVRRIGLWLSSPGVLATLHYDTYHNCFVQVAGRKRVVLIPPEIQQGIRLYPSLHPGYRQSQRLHGDYMVSQNSSSSIKSTIKTLSLPYFDFVAEPGDIVYIPPFWFHATQALTYSASVNVWTYDAFLGIVCFSVSVQLYYIAAFLCNKGKRGSRIFRLSDSAH